MIMTKEQAILKAKIQFNQMEAAVRKAAAEGQTIDQVERDLWERLLGGPRQMGTKRKLSKTRMKQLSEAIIESPHSGVRLRTRRVNNWNVGRMVLRRATAAFLETEKHFKRIGGYKQLWMLKSYLDDLEKDKALAEKRKAG